jgi:DNA-binding NarL/FixJ family response regulator
MLKAKTKTIIIVDPNYVQGHNLFSLLKGSGHGPIYCPNKEDAVRTLQTHSIAPTFTGSSFATKEKSLVDVIIVDLTAHKEGQTATEIDEKTLSEGLESSLSFVRELRKTYKNIPIIVAGNTLTNKTITQNRKAVAAGANCFISKSTHTDKLLEIIGRITQKDSPQH